MNYELVTQILKELGIPFAYYEFDSPPGGDKYIAYYESGRDNFGADDAVYNSDIRFTIELYTKKKDTKTEEKLTALFEKYEVFWTSGPQAYIDTEKMLQSVFYV